MSSPKKVVLAYSGGLDTSIILKWLRDRVRLRGRHLHRRPRPGRGAGAGARARPSCSASSPENIFIEDLREEFVRDFVFPMFRANALYEGHYLLGTSIARPLIAKRLVEIAAATGADAVAHGATGKGNDQVRFELAAYALDPSITVIAPWRALGPDQPHPAARVRRGAPDPDRQGQARRGAVLGRRQPPAHLLRGQGAGEPGRGGARLRLPAHRRPRGGARHARIRRDRLREGRRRRDRRRAAVAGDAADPAQRARRPQRRRPARPRREPLRRHEVARHLRDPGRHRAARRAPRHRVDHPRPRRRAPQGRADAALRRARSTTASGSRPSARCCRRRSTAARSASRARCG